MAGCGVASSIRSTKITMPYTAFVQSQIYAKIFNFKVLFRTRLKCKFETRTVIGQNGAKCHTEIMRRMERFNFAPTLSKNITSPA
jgi:hypothetical protein